MRSTFKVSFGGAGRRVLIRAKKRYINKYKGTKISIMRYRAIMKLLRWYIKVPIGYIALINMKPTKRPRVKAANQVRRK